MRIAVVFDTIHPEWEEADFWREFDAGVEEAEYEVADALRRNGHEVRLIGIRDDIRVLVDRLTAFEPELVFNCCESFRDNAHYEYGVAALLEMHGYRHTGSPATALLVARNKSMSKKILRFHGIRVPEFAVFHAGEPFLRPSAVRHPLIVKPLLEDASIGIAQASVVADDASLEDRVRFIHEKFDQAAIAEELIEGRELYVGLIGNAELLMLPPIEMHFGRLPKAERRIATWKAKWDVEYRERHKIRTGFARRLPPEIMARLRWTCETAFRALWLEDYGRMDLRLTHDGEVYVIEANPNPFISYGHEFANAAEKAGLKYRDFIERIVQLATTRHEHEP